MKGSDEKAPKLEKEKRNTETIFSHIFSLENQTNVCASCSVCAWLVKYERVFV